MQYFEYTSNKHAPQDPVLGSPCWVSHAAMCPESGGWDCPIASTWIKENIYLWLYGIRGLVSSPPSTVLHSLQSALLRTYFSPQNILSYFVKDALLTLTAVTITTLVTDLTDTTSCKCCCVCRKKNSPWRMTGVAAAPLCLPSLVIYIALSCTYSFFCVYNPRI